MAELAIDRLSALPDPIKITILGRLGLKEAAATAVLSKQWRFLWRNVPLAFRIWSTRREEIERFVANVSTVLAINEGSRLLSLLFDFVFYTTFSSDVNSWLDVAAERNVHDLSLYLQRGSEVYTLPQTIYSHSSLRNLGLSNCKFPLPETKVEWQFLKSLSLKFVDMSEQVVEKMLSCCPYLETLDLVGCWGFSLSEVGGFRMLKVKKFRLTNCSIAALGTAEVDWRYMTSLCMKCVDLTQQTIENILLGCPHLETLDLVDCSGFDRLSIECKSFHRLNVTHCSGDGEGLLERGEHLLEIRAPYLRDLHIRLSCGKTGKRQLRLQDVSSIETVYVDLSEIDCHSGISVDRLGEATTELFLQLEHVKTLHLSQSCTKVVSLLATNGWKPPTLLVEELHMESESSVQSIYGVVAMLESSPCIERLAIHGYIHRYDIPELEEVPSFQAGLHMAVSNQIPIIWGTTIKDDMDGDLLHLKSVEFVDFLDSDAQGEPALTLAKILLKRAPVLEKMKIRKLFSRVGTVFIKETLLTYPKSSTKVSIDVVSTFSVTAD